MHVFLDMHACNALLGNARAHMHAHKQQDSQMSPRLAAASDDTDLFLLRNFPCEIDVQGTSTWYQLPATQRF